MKPFDFKDMNLIPKKGIVSSRSKCETGVMLGKHYFKIPVVPANMSSIIDTEIAKKLAKNGYFYILHRFLSNEEILIFCKYMHSQDLIISLSLGVNKDSKELFEILLENNLVPDYVTIDIAHGHCELMQNMLNFIDTKCNYYNKEKPFIIAGNISTQDAANDLKEWGANAIKVGIGNGSVCTTYYCTGFGSRNIQASIINEIKTTLPIIADGGVTCVGDVVKSLVLGATMVMSGGLYAGCVDLPGYNADGFVYHGSASSLENKVDRIEGTSKVVSIKQDILTENKFIIESIQSAISYGGGVDLHCFDTVEYTIIGQEKKNKLFLD